MGVEIGGDGSGRGVKTCSNIIESDVVLEGLANIVVAARLSLAGLGQVGLRSQ